MTDSTSDLHEDTIFWAKESTQNTEAANVQNASVADCELIDAHVEGELTEEDGLREEDALAEGEETPADEEASITFADLGLSEGILGAVTRTGFMTPTPIQVEAILVLLELNDVVGITQTGTGRTAAFVLLILAIVDTQERGVQALVLTPTRELTMQSAQAIDDFASMMRDLDVMPACGSSPYGPQISALKCGAQIVVDTPGHVIDLIEKGALDPSQIRMLVLDEADGMLRMGFTGDMGTITASAPEDRLTALFSATMPPAIERIANTHLKNLVRTVISRESSAVDAIHQVYMVMLFKRKLGVLTRVLATRAQHVAEGQEDVDAAIISVRAHVGIGEMSLETSARGFRAAGISGGVMQTERKRMVGRLRAGTLSILVATGVATRGLDVERISLVVNFDVPREPEAYIHRIDRTNRAGREGRPLTFFALREHDRLRRIEKLTGTRMEEVQIPSPAAVPEFRTTRLLKSLNARIKKKYLELYKGLLKKTSEEGGNSTLGLTTALMANAAGDDGSKPRVAKDSRPKRSKSEGELDESNEFLGASLEERDRDRPLKASRDSSRRRAPESLGSAIRYRVEVGREDHVKPGSIVDAVAGEGGIEDRDIRHVEIFPSFSLVEISGELSEDQLSRISRGYIQGRPLRVRVDEGSGKDRAERARSSDKARRFDRPERERAKREYPRRYEEREGFVGVDRNRDHDRLRGLKDHKRRADQGTERFDNQRGIREERVFSRFRDEERRERSDRGVSRRRFGEKGREEHSGREFDQRNR